MSGLPPLGGVRSLAPGLPGRLAAAALRVAVIGDVMLDGWWSGVTERFCREAPAPVVDLQQKQYAPGGAANTAMNLQALGARVRLAGLTGTAAEDTAAPSTESDEREES